MSLTVITPTNSGKTWIAYFCLYLGTDKGRISFYLTPTTLLVYQKYKELKRVFGEKAKIIKLTGESRPLIQDLRKSERQNQKLIFVCTFESFRAFLFSIQKKEYFPKRDIIGAVVVDEFHAIGERSRGVDLETLLYKVKFEYIDVKKKDKLLLCFLSGTFPRESAKYWSERYETKLIYFPTNRKFNFVIDAKEKALPLEKIKDLVQKFLKKHCYRPRESGELPIAPLEGQEKYRKPRKASSLAKMLIFVKSREKAKEISDHLKEELKGYGRKAFQYIHAGLSKSKKEAIFNNFNHGNIMTLSCSPILESGVDIRNIEEIIITDPESYSKIELEQIIGRCRELLGVIIHLVHQGFTGTFKETVKFLDPEKRIFSGYKLEQINSQIEFFDAPRIILEYLYRRQPSLEQIDEHLKKVLPPNLYDDFFNIFTLKEVLSWYIVQKEPVLLSLISMIFCVFKSRPRRRKKPEIYRDLIRELKGKYALTFLGDAVVETQLPITAALKLYKFFEKNKKPKSKEMVRQIAFVGKRLFPEDKNKVEIIYKIIENYSQNKVKNKKIFKREEIPGGDVDTYRRRAMWLSCDLHLLYQAFQFHSKAPLIGNYYDIDYEKARDEVRTVFYSIKRVIERYNDEKEVIYFPLPERTRRKRVKSSQYCKSILQEVKNSGENGVTVKEIHQVLMKKFPSISEHAIRVQLMVLGDRLEVIEEPIKRGRAAKRYFIAAMRPKEKEGLFCEECNHFTAHSIKISKE